MKQHAAESLPYINIMDYFSTERIVLNSSNRSSNLIRMAIVAKVKNCFVWNKVKKIPWWKVKKFDDDKRENFKAANSSPAFKQKGFNYCVSHEGNISTALLRERVFLNYKNLSFIDKINFIHFTFYGGIRFKFLVYSFIYWYRIFLCSEAYKFSSQMAVISILNVWISNIKYKLWKSDILWNMTKF